LFNNIIIEKLSQVKEGLQSYSVSFLDIYLNLDNNGQLSIILYGNFNFAIINFPNFDSYIIPTVSAYEVYISQLIRYTRAFSLYSDVLRRYRLLSTKLFQATDFLKNHLVLSFKTFFGRYEYLVNKFLTCARHDERWCWQLHFGSTLTIIGSLMSCDDLVYYLILK
jgi:hypothetical protein